MKAIVHEIAERQFEPGWARAKRFQSLLAFEEIPMPLGTEETWRRTDIRSLPLASFLPAESERASERHREPGSLESGENPPPLLRTPAPSLPLTPRGGLLIQEDSHLLRSALAEELTAQGVIFCDLGTALARHPDLVREHLWGACVSPTESKLTAMNGALWSGGVLLYVPAGLEVSLPFQAIYRIGRTGAGAFPHTLIVVGSGSRVDYLEEVTSCPDVGEALSCGVVEIFLAEGAYLGYTSLQQLGNRISHFSTQRALVGRDSSLRWIDCTLGGRVTKSHLEGLLLEPGGRVEQTGLFFGATGQHMDFSPLLHHQAPHTTGEVLFKGVLKGKARSVFQGLIRVGKEARRTDSFLTNHNLILSPKGRADSIPRLEIDNNDVRCSHAVTAGRVDEEQIFYLMSRGLRKAEAIQLIVSGFFEEACRRIPWEEEREKLRAILQQKIESVENGGAEVHK